jgi:hypothetical protein
MRANDDERGMGMTDTDTTAKKVPRWRRILCGALVVIVCLLAPLALLAVWTHNTLLNTDQYVETVGPLAEDPAIQQAISNRVVEALKANVNIEDRVQDALPERAAFVAPFVASGIESFAREASLRLAESDRFQNLWNEANRRAHTQVVAVLTGEGSDRVSTKNGEVVVRLGPIVESVKSRLSNLGLDIFDNSSGTRVSRQLVLFKSEELTKIQGGVDLLDSLAWVLPILLLVLLALAILISPNRRRTVLRTAIWIAVGMALVLVLFNVGRTFYLDAVTGAGANHDAAAAAYDQILSFLRTSARTAFVVAVIVAIGAWVAGPGRAATRIRGTFTGMGSGGESGVEPSPIGLWVARYRTALRVVIIGVALVVLIAMNRVTPLTVLVIAIIVVALLVLVEFLARNVPRDSGGGGSGGGESSPAAPASKRPAPMKASAAKKSS